MSAREVSGVFEAGGVGLAACATDAVEIAALPGGVSALERAAAARGVSLPARGRIADAGDGLVLSVRPGRWLILASPATPAALAGALQEASLGCGAAVDLSSALVALHVSGRATREMLARGCRLDLDPEHGESEHARWYMTDDESAPYSPDLDRSIPKDVVIPGVIISGKYSGDRAEVNCAGQWAAGRWALEVSRGLKATSPYHVGIRSGVFMRVAAFDHTQIRHTRHVRPVRVEMQ